MTVVVIVGVVVALAMPSFEDRLRDRRANQAAQEAAYAYRTARARALGRGAAQLVRFSTGTRTLGQLTTFEAIEPANATSTVGSCGSNPVSSCDNNWLNAANVRALDTFPNDEGLYGQVGFQFQLSSTANSPQSFAEICFPPSGRAVYRTAAGAAWTVLTSVPEIDVQRYDTKSAAVGILRRVLLTPNGTARLAL